MRRIRRGLFELRPCFKQLFVEGNEKGDEFEIKVTFYQFRLSGHAVTKF